MDQLVFSVDADGTNFVDETFDGFERHLHSSIYHGENHVIGARNLLALSRVLPKKNDNFKGFARTSYKITQDVVVLGEDGLAQLTVPAIVKTEYVLPVGIDAGIALAIRRRNAAVAGSESVVEPLTMSQAVYQ